VSFLSRKKIEGIIRILKLFKKYKGKLNEYFPFRTTFKMNEGFYLMENSIFLLMLASL